MVNKSSRRSASISLKVTLLVFAATFTGCSDSFKDEKPNIIIFYVDDLGYGDVGCYGAKGVSTPNIDSLASNGIRFTDAHCTSATCTPSRYSLLTGRYAFRNNAAILPGDAPLLIDTSLITLPAVLSQAGYNTAVIGKWHLGLGRGKIDWNTHVSPGANELGFGYSFLIPATGDRVPSVFVENGYVVNHDGNDPIQVDYSKPIGNDPTGSEHPKLLKMKADPQHSNTIVNGISRIGYMSGGKKARWIDEDFPFIFNQKSAEFINGSKDKPFFLLYSFHDIHVPRVPHKNFAGKSSLGPRGDAIVQVDWVVGELIHVLKSTGRLDNTLIIFTSDNGAVLDDGYADMAEELIGGHDPNGGLKGGKYSAYEAGTRVPTIVYWKDRVSPGVSSALLSQVDLLASLAALTGTDVSGHFLDSENQLTAWLGKDQTGRNELLEESFTLAIRQGRWKYIKPFDGKTPEWLANKDIEVGLAAEAQLFDLAADPGERHNLADAHPEKVQELHDRMNHIIEKTN